MMVWCSSIGRRNVCRMVGRVCCRRRMVVCCGIVNGYGTTGAGDERVPDSPRVRRGCPRWVHVHVRRARAWSRSCRTVTLADWLLAQIEADEKVARECRPLRVIHPMGAEIGNPETYSHSVNTYAGEDGYPRRDFDKSVPAHFSRHDPARVLAECAAKRALIELHEVVWGRNYCFDCGDTHPCPTLRILAQPFADRPGWSEEWRL
jgi:Family of unknown function (DUF6221)